jgi:hypothetical protein
MLIQIHQILIDQSDNLLELTNVSPNELRVTSFATKISVSFPQLGQVWV